MLLYIHDHVTVYLKISKFYNWYVKPTKTSIHLIIELSIQCGKNFLH